MAAQFGVNKNLATRTNEIKTFKDFLGLDVYNNPINVNAIRSPKMKNFIFKDGANRKRSGFVQKGLFANEKINGFWEFEDSIDHNIHTIVHVGTTIYKLTFNDSPHLNAKTILKQSGDSTATSTYVKGILDQKSFGIVRDNVLYLLVGENYLMYSRSNFFGVTSWSLTEVTSKAYIPTTRIGISSIDSATNMEAPFEDVNLLQPFRYNTLIGENITIAHSYDYWEGSAYFPTDPHRYLTNNIALNDAKNINIVITKSVTDAISGQTYVVPVATYEAELTGSIVELYYNYQDQDNDDALTDFVIADDSADDFNDIFKYCYLKHFYRNGKLYLDFIIDFGTYNKYTANISVFNSDGYNLITGSKVYQLDSDSLDSTGLEVINTDTNTTLISGTDYTYNALKGQITLIGTNLAPLVEGQSNIKVKFKPDKTTANWNDQFDLIKKCRFGIMFGYNEEQQLFVSGNPDYPNMDWHTTTKFNETGNNNELSQNEDLTYFSDLSYFKVGTPVNEISGYTLLNDNCMAIHKTNDANETSLWIRQSYVENKTDINGNVIRDNDGNAYKGIYYNMLSSANGESCLNPFTCKNLNGDKLFLSHNGLFSITIDSNIKSNERYATLRSKNVNNLLTKEPNIGEAAAIVFDGKYFLAIKNHIYIFDSNYLYNTGDYECWYWELEPYYDNAKITISDNSTVPIAKTTDYLKLNNGFYHWDNNLEEYAEVSSVPINVYKELEIATLFIKDNKLWFGTKDGRLCAFDDTGYEDIIYDVISATLTNQDEEDGHYEDIQFDATYTKEYNAINVVPSGVSDNNSTSYDERYVYQIIGSCSVEETGGDQFYPSIDEYHNILKYHLNDTVYLMEADSLISNESYTIEDYYEAYGFIKFRPKSNPTMYYSQADDSIAITIVTKLDGHQEFKLSDNSTSQNPLYNILTPNNQDIVKLLAIGSVSTFNMICYCKKPVEALWWTPVMDLGTPMYSKTMNYITIVPNTYGDGEIFFGYLTKDKYVSSRTEGVDIFDLDMNNLNFEYFSTDPSKFHRAFSKKVKVKKFNFIQFIIRSVTNRECSINEFMISYYFTKRNKGIK